MFRNCLKDEGKKNKDIGFKIILLKTRFVVLITFEMPADKIVFKITYEDVRKMKVLRRR